MGIQVEISAFELTSRTIDADDLSTELDDAISDAIVQSHTCPFKPAE